MRTLTHSYTNVHTQLPVRWWAYTDKQTPLKCQGLGGIEWVAELLWLKGHTLFPQVKNREERQTKEGRRRRREGNR